MALTELRIPPGIYANGPELARAGRWADGNLVRWVRGHAHPVGGWQRTLASALAGPLRGALAWRDLSQNRWMAIGGPDNLYVWDGGDIDDITPIGLTPGRADSIAGVGFGASTYGSSTYGTPRTSTSLLQEATVWSLTNWGENLIACANTDGAIYEWVPGSNAAAAPIANAPTDCYGVIVTGERHLVALGAGGDPRLIQWSDREDNTNWTPSSTSLAGSLQLVTNGRARCALQFRGEVFIWTELDLHIMRYVGSPFVYGIERQGEGGVVGPMAAALIPSGPIWMGYEGFYIYDGAPRILPSDVRDVVFEDINREQLVKVVAGVNEAYTEVWWFYPSAASVENDRYVIYNWVEGSWSVGTLSRTSWVRGGVWDRPIAADASGMLYLHESGHTADGQSLNAYLQSGPVQLGDGDRIMRVRGLVFDEQNTPGAYTVTLTAKRTPNDPSPVTDGPRAMRSDGYVDARVSGRQISVRIEQALDADWSIGAIRVDAQPGGRR